MTRAVWDELNARPIKAPPAWVRNRAWVEPITPPPLVGRVRRLRSEPPCPSCGNSGSWQCECETSSSAKGRESANNALPENQ